MYTNIDSNHRIENVNKWLIEFEDELPAGFTTQQVIEALALILNNTTFEIGNSYFKQINSTSMGTPVACIYTTLYYAYHDQLLLLQKYPNTIFLQCYIND